MSVDLVVLQLEVEKKYKNWMETPGTLSRIKSLRDAVEQYQGALVDELIGKDPCTARRGDTATDKDSGKIHIPERKQRWNV